MSAHTPGPWKVRAGSFAEDGIPSYEVTMNGAPTINANDAALIAAAPELLAACRELVVAVAAAMRVIADLDAMKALGADASTREQRLVDELKISGVPNGFGVRANAAIAKAEGR